MKKILNFTEEEIEKIIHMVLEHVNLSDYTEEDFIEVFFSFFRPWIKKHHGDEVGQYPLSYLVKEYLPDFRKDLGISEEGYFYGSTAKRLELVGRKIVEKGLTSLPTLKPKKGFLQRFEKPLESIIENLGLPSSVKFTFEEKSPYSVDAYLKVDFQEYIKSENKAKGGSIFFHEFRKYLENYLGVKYGLPSHGHLSLTTHGPSYYNVDEWVKTTLEKKLKPEIKKLPGVKGNLHSIKFTTDPFQMDAKLKLSFKGHTSWERQRNITDMVRNYMKEQGYNTNILRVDN